jgi:hypothetical protein
VFFEQCHVNLEFPFGLVVNAAHSSSLKNACDYLPVYKRGQNGVDVLGP